MDAESSAESGPEKATRSNVDERIASAVDIAAAASPAKKAKRDTSVGLFRQCLSEKTRPVVVVEAVGATNSDVRQALVDIINAYVHKVRAMRCVMRGTRRWVFYGDYLHGVDL